MDFSHVENPQFALSQILSCSLAGNAEMAKTGAGLNVRFAPIAADL
jgi:hypothetical protein